MCLWYDNFLKNDFIFSSLSLSLSHFKYHKLIIHQKLFLFPLPIIVIFFLHLLLLNSFALVSFRYFALDCPPSLLGNLKGIFENGLPKKKKKV